MHGCSAHTACEEEGLETKACLRGCKPICISNKVVDLPSRSVPVRPSLPNPRCGQPVSTLSVITCLSHIGSPSLIVSSAGLLAGPTTLRRLGGAGFPGS